MKNIFNLKSYFKFLRRNKAYTIIDIFGLSISLMFVIIIGVYNIQERSVDKFNKKADRIYAFGMSMRGDSFTGGHYGLQKKLRDRYPEIESSCAVVIASETFKNSYNENINIVFMLTDSTFYHIFDFNLIRGDKRSALNAPEKAVISEKLARQLFHDEDPIGKSIQFNDSVSLTVSAIMEPMENSSFRNNEKKMPEMIVSFDLMEYANQSMAKSDVHMSNGTGADIYLLCRQGSDLLSKQADMDTYLKSVFWMFNMPGVKTNTELVKYSDLYFSNFQSSNGNHIIGDKKMVNILFAVGLAILIFALMNYINLTVAQAGFRAKEMATRRLLGSSRTDIIIRLITESTMLCIISFTIGILLSFIFAPYAGNLLDTELNLYKAVSPATCIFMLGIIIVIGFAAGILPAMLISSSKPIDVVRGTLRRKTKMVFSKVFITFQNAITIIMIGVSLTMILQIRHLINAPLGYDTDNLVIIDEFDRKNVDAFINELGQLSCVSMISKCQGSPYNGGNNNTIVEDGKTISLQVLKGDKNYMKIFGLSLEKDNHLANKDGIYVNHQALSEMNLKDDATMFFTKPIAGILNDFYIRDIEAEQHPLYLKIENEIKNPWEIIIKTKGNPIDAYQQISNAYKNVFGIEPNNDHPFLDQKIQNQYDAQMRLSKIMSLFTFIAILISLLGLLAMSTYFIQQRQQEIALRKVLGSSSKEIMVKLIRTFLIYVLLAFIIAVPAIYYFMHGWLSDYSYRIELSWWIYAVAGISCLLISFVTVFFQSYHAANANPVNSLKNN